MKSTVTQRSAVSEKVDLENLLAVPLATECSTLQPGDQDKNRRFSWTRYEAHQDNIFSLKPLWLRKIHYNQIYGTYTIWCVLVRCKPINIKHESQIIGSSQEGSTTKILKFLPYLSIVNVTHCIWRGTSKTPKFTWRQESYTTNQSMKRVFQGLVAINFTRVILPTIIC